MKNGKAEMENGKPAQWRRQWFRSFPAFPLPVFHFLFSVLLLSPSLSRAESTTATVTGTARVVVRRGPGKQFPPFATLTHGSTVEVQEVRGEWARISTAAGHTGYVNSNFLALKAETQSPAPVATATASATVEAPALAALTERNKSLEAQLHSLQDELAGMKARAAMAPTPAAASSPGTDQLHAELGRLTASIESLQRRLDAQPAMGPLPAGSSVPIVPQESPPHGVSPTAVLMTLAGILVGWLLGSGYGRKLDRGRRSRIRF
jgi:SH3 domain-containing protein